MLFEARPSRAARKPTIREDLDRLHDADRLTPDRFRGSRIFAIPRSKDTYSEPDPETAILRELDASSWSSEPISHSSLARSG